MQDKQLFKVQTKRCGEFYVVATSFDEAANAVRDELDAQDYGFSSERYVTSVDFVRREQWMSNGKRALYGDNDINHFIICGSTDPEETERHYAEQLAKLTEEKEMLKQEISGLTARPEKMEN